MYTELIPEQQAPRPKLLEFEGQGGLIMNQFVDWDAPELFQFVNDNRDSNAQFAPTLNEMLTEHDVLRMITNPGFNSFGARKEKHGPLAAIATVAQEFRLKEEPSDKISPGTGNPEVRFVKDPNGIASLGFVVAKEFMRQGVATNLVKTMSQLLLKIPGTNTIRCQIDPKNEASRKLLESCGFREAGGKIGRYVFYDLDKPSPGDLEN